MKKVFLAILIVLFASAAWAEVKFELSGDMHARGSYWKNFSQGGPAADYESENYSDYDGDVNLYPKISVGDTSLNMKIAIRDETWGKVDRDDLEVDTNPDTNSVYNSYTGSKDDNINIERAYLQHKFGKNTTLEVGLMDGQVWATSFADYLMGRYRVKLVQMTPFGALGALVEKDAELGDAFKDSEKDDYDSYALFAVTKAGSVYIKPLIFYVYNGGWNKMAPPIPTQAGLVDVGLTTIDADNDALTVLYLALGFDGTLGPIEFESELGYKKYDAEGSIRAVNDDNSAIPAGTVLSTFDNDWTIWGAYLNIWKTLDGMRPGLILTYGSWDDEGGPTKAGFGWDNRDDFCSNLILGDWIAWGDNTGADEDIVGMTLIKPYIADVKLADKLSASASFGYIMSNQKDNAYEDATAWEVDLGVAYSITDNLVYSVDAGYADISYDVEGVEDPDGIILAQHKIKFKF